MANILEVTDQFIEVEWTCPVCTALMTDAYDKTVIPYCELCGSDVEWDEVLTPDEMGRLNEMYISYLHQS